MPFVQRQAPRLIGILIATAVTAVAAGAAAPPSLVYTYDAFGNLTRVSSTATDPDNCGGRAVSCSISGVATRACVDGSCSASVCVADFADCDGNKQSNGCETYISTTWNCGGCGLACSTNHVTSTACVGRSCSAGLCAGGWADCNGNKQTDGCETSITTVSNCGGCGVVCSANHVTPACSGGSCNPGVCAAGWGDCNGNKQTDGCEASLTSSISSCGGCGMACSANHVTPACSGGSCSGGVCAAGWADCNGNKQADGCESFLATDVNNCGACGRACTYANGYGKCSAGACVFTGCKAGYHSCGDDVCVSNANPCP